MCPALRAQASTAVAAYTPASPGEFEAVKVPGKAHIDAADAAWLGAVLAKADLIEGWLDAVRAEAHRRLTVGDKVPGWKLVTGKRGNRAWSNSTEAEALMKETFRLKSPTKAEELHKAEAIGPRQWPKLQALITQADGKPSVAPESDKRPALQVTPVADEFEAVAEDLSEFA